MKPSSTLRVVSFLCGLCLSSCTSSRVEPNARLSPMKSGSIETAQVPGWSRQDLEFFLHGSMSTEVVPETVLRAFIRAYPNLFAGQDFSEMGFIADKEFGWPIGFSRSRAPHLGGLSSVGIN